MKLIKNFAIQYLLGANKTKASMTLLQGIFYQPNQLCGQWDTLLQRISFGKNSQKAVFLILC